jgi:hypothetical protein
MYDVKIFMYIYIRIKLRQTNVVRYYDVHIIYGCTYIWFEHSIHG